MSGYQKDTSAHTSVICPGQQNLMDGYGSHYLRVVFTAYWQNSMPSTEVFYLTQYPIRLNRIGIENLQNEMIGWFRSNGYTNITRLIYVSYGGIEMSDADVEEAGWRVFVGHVPVPPPPPVPVPVPVPVPPTPPTPPVVTDEPPMPAMPRMPHPSA